MSKYQSYINGSFTNIKATFDNYGPVLNKTYAKVADATANDAKAAIEAAQKAFPAWAALSPAERGEYLIKVAEAIEEMGPEIEEILINEVGSWIGKAKFQLSYWTID